MKQYNPSSPRKIEQSRISSV